MTKQIKLTTAQADLLGAGYICLKNAIELLRMLNREPGLHHVIGMYNSGWIADLTITQDKMDRRLKCNERFEEDIKQNDTLRLMEINRLFMRSSPENQEAIEDMFRAINEGEGHKIKIVHEEMEAVNG